MKKYIFAVCSVALAALVVAFGVSAYDYYRALHADDPIDPYIFVEKGMVSIVRGSLAIDLSRDERYDLIENDTVITQDATEATIFWPDRSTTRLGENTKFAIQVMKVADDYSKIELEATLLEGKAHTNIIRTLYPGSYMNLRLPSKGVVAGVRGTVFSVNLEQNYIHSIDHIVALKNSLFQSVLLLPGEIASAGNIFEKLTRDVLDMAWEQANAVKDAAYKSAYIQEMTAAFEKIRGNLTTVNYWDVLVRSVLSYFDAFKELEMVQKISSLDIEAMTEVPTQYLLKWYQKLKIGDFAGERDVIRGTLFRLSEADAGIQQFLETLVSESVWDKLQFPSLDLSNADMILSKYGAQFSLDPTVLIENLSSKKYGEELQKSIQSLFSEK